MLRSGKVETRMRRKTSIPVPPPLNPWVTLPALLAGVLGTGLLYRAATSGTLLDLVAGGFLFALGLRVAGRPFVWASAMRRARYRGPQRHSPTAKPLDSLAPPRRDRERNPAP